jgi:hypothetical protein
VMMAMMMVSVRNAVAILCHVHERDGPDRHRSVRNLRADHHIDRRSLVRC